MRTGNNDDQGTPLSDVYHRAVTNPMTDERAVREPWTVAGRRLFSDVDPMDMLESNGVTWDDILAIEDEAAAGVGLDVERLLRIEAAAFAYREQFRRIKGVPLAVDLGEAIDEERDALFDALASGTDR
jgi:hypothetical protein